MDNDYGKWRKLKSQTKEFKLDIYEYKGTIYINTLPLLVDCGIKYDSMNTARELGIHTDSSFKDSI